MATLIYRNCSHCNSLFSQPMGGSRMCCSVECRDIRRQYGMPERIEKYNLSPKLCKECNTPFTYQEAKTKTFCNRSCAGKYNMAHSDPNRKHGPAKQSEKLKEHKEELPKIGKWSSLWKDDVIGEYCKIFYCECKHCNIKWIGRSVKKYCKDHEVLYSHEGRALYWFTFGISKYPDLFDGEIIKQYGMRSLTNPNGVTRDHRVSANEAIRNGYDPYYIKHPLNCELMLFEENNKKKTKSSIPYEELVRQVKEYDSKKVV